MGKMKMGFSWQFGLLISFFMLGIQEVHCQKKIKCVARPMSETTSLCSNKQKVVLTLTEPSPNSMYILSYCRCTVESINCYNDLKCNWKNATCREKGQNGCVSFVIENLELWKFKTYAVKVVDLRHKAEQFELYDQFLLSRSFAIIHCFIDHKPEVTVNPGDKNSIDIQWRFHNYDRLFTGATPYTLTVTNTKSGKLLSTDHCKQNSFCTCGTLCNCKMNDLLPCETYKICVELKIFASGELQKDKTRNCQNYTVPLGVVPRIDNIDSWEKRVTKKRRFFWTDPEFTSPGLWFYTFRLRSKRNTITKNTTRTFIDLDVPRDTQKCHVSVSKCVPCGCGEPVRASFDNCALSLVTPEPPPKSTGEKEGPPLLKPAIIWISIIAVVVLVFLLVLVIFIKRYLQQSLPEREPGNLPDCDEIISQREREDIPHLTYFDPDY